MIPKIIHLCWLSGDPYPQDIQNCLDSWKKYLPDYEVWVWDRKRFDVDSVLWTKQAFKSKKYAFAADYIRLYALYNYGGIYLDSDVLMYKSFDDLLDLPYFIGQDYTRAFEAAVIGAEQGTPWIKEVLEYYDNRSFVLEDGSLDTVPLPQIFYKQLKDKHAFYKLHKIEKYTLDDNFCIFDNDFFNSRNSVGVKRTSKSYCAHNYAGKWKNSDNTLKTRLKRLIPISMLHCYYYISHHTFNRGRLGHYEPPFASQIHAK